jgi:hypothetical protein
VVRDDRPTSVALLPYVSTTFNRISRVLSRHNIKSVGLPPRKIANFQGPVKDNLGLKHLVSTAYRTNAVKFTLGRLAVLLIPGSRNTTGTFVWPSQTNWQWLNTASAGDIASNSKTPRSYPANPVTWIGLSRRPLRSSFIRTT